MNLRLSRARALEPLLIRSPFSSRVSGASWHAALVIALSLLLPSYQALLNSVSGTPVPRVMHTLPRGAHPGLSRTTALTISIRHPRDSWQIARVIELALWPTSPRAQVRGLQSRRRCAIKRERLLSLTYHHPCNSLI